MSRVFLREYIKNLRTVGAVLPSSRYLARKMVEQIDFSNARIIVQFGPGTGSFTKELITRKQPKTKLLLIERNKAFCDELQKKFGQHDNVLIVCDTAEHLPDILRKHRLSRQVDCIVSGLPFASLPQGVSHAVLDVARKHTKRGMFVTFQYTLLKRRLFDNYFSDISIRRELRNVPPAYVLWATNKE